MSAPAPAFVHLHVHTEFSLLDSIIRVKRPGKLDVKEEDRNREQKAERHLDSRFLPLSEHAADLGYPAVAVTDLGNLFAMVKFYKASEKAGLKPIIGADLWVEESGDGDGVGLVTLLVTGDTGYRNLVRLVSRAYTEGQSRGQPRVKRDWLLEAADGLIALCGPRSGIGHLLTGQHDRAAMDLLASWKAAFGDRLYLELQRCGRPDDDHHVAAAVRLARASQTPVVATNDVRFLRRADFEAHEARVCIATGQTLDNDRRPREFSIEQYLKSPEEMQTLFADLPEALENAVEIARRCSLTLTFGETHLPDFPVPDGETVDSWLRREAVAGLAGRMPERAPPASYTERLEYELDVIEQMRYSGYFLVVADFIAWAKAQDIPVGPGRGSGAGSLVAYALGITDLDPMPHDLLFERFLNPERVSLPDFDVDFCMDRRDEVIGYVQERYGRDHVGQIITYGTMAARAVVRDVARVLGHPYGVGDRIAKMIPGGPTGLPLDVAIEEVPELRRAYESEEDVRAVIDLALPLEGLTRNVGKHAGGVVIAPRPLTDFAPLYCEPGGGGLVTQFDMKDLEAVGLIKFDFLGLKTLTIIQTAVQQVNARRGPDTPPVDMLAVPLDDPDTYRLYASGRTAAVFQMESHGMQRSSQDLRPDRFEDLIALISLFRPGPMELIPQFVKRKHGEERVEVLHPEIEEVLRPTLGIFVYQEQVMQVAQRLAGYSLGGADLLRRAMGKKIASEMAQQRDVFVEGAVKRGVDRRNAVEVFDLMERFADYGFNKSHAAAYALVSYQTAWLKVHHPAEYMAAVLSCDMDKTDTVVLMINECRRMKLDVRPPDINHSGFAFEVRGPREIAYGLGAVKGAGEGALRGVLDARAKDGPFQDLFDLCRRVDLQKSNKRVLEALIGAGALDGFGANRASLTKTLPKAMALAEQGAASRGAGQSDMFGLAPATPDGSTLMVEVTEWRPLERLRVEKETLGLYLSGHPIEAYRPLIRQLCDGTLEELSQQGGQRTVKIGGWVTEVRRQGRRLNVIVDDRTAQLTCVLGEDLMEAHGAPPKDTLLFATGRISPDNFTGGWRMFVNSLQGMEEVSRRYAERVVVDWPADRELDLDALEAAMEPARAPDGCMVTVRYGNGVARASLDLGARWRIGAQPEQLDTLRRLVGEGNVRVKFGRPEARVGADA